MLRRTPRSTRTYTLVPYTTLFRSLLGCAAIPGCGLAEIVRDAAAQLVRLTEVELRIGVAGDGERAPFGDGRLIVAALPRLDSRLHVGMGGRGGQRRRGERQRQQGGYTDGSHRNSLQ